MDRLTLYMAVALCLTACTKSTEPEWIAGSDELVVTVQDAECSTKSVLDGTSTKFASGDQIRVFDTAGKSAIYKYRTRTSEGNIFQKVYAQSGFDKTNFASAFYPNDCLDTTKTTKDKYVAVMKDSTAFVNGSFPKGAAPMACFGKSGDKIVFSNCFAVLGVSVKYDSTPVTPLSVKTITLTSSSTKLSGTFEITNTSVTKTGSDGANTMTLTGCDAAGALSTTEKRFYIAVPGVTSSETMTVNVTPVTDVPFSGTFTANASGSSSVLARNYILNLNSFILKPVVSGGYSVADWVDVGNIKVGQITLSKTAVSVAKGSSVDVQINGVSDWNEITTKIVSGDSYFERTKKKDADKYYITITGKAAGTGRLFVNDGVSNSGSYIDITVN